MLLTVTSHSEIVQSYWYTVLKSVKKNEGETDIGIYDINSICLPEIFDKEFQNQKL